MKTSTTTAIAVAALASVSSAATLFENAVLPPNGDVASAYNQVNPTNADENHFLLTKVVVTDPAGWSINSISTYGYHNADWATLQAYFGGTGQDRLSGIHVHVVPDSGLATFDPTLAGDIFAGTATEINGGPLSSFQTRAGTHEMRVDLPSSIDIGPGTYWIGATPIFEDWTLTWGLSFAQTSAYGGAGIAEFQIPGSGGSPSINPTVAGVWEQTSGIESAIKIEGNVIPEPSSTALLGLGALGLLFRRKRS